MQTCRSSTGRRSPVPGPGYFRQRYRPPDSTDSPPWRCGSGGGPDIDGSLQRGLTGNRRGTNHIGLKHSTDILRRIELGWHQPRIFNRLLLPLSWLYCALAVLVRLSWRIGLRRPERVGVPVLVVGNLTVGGTGKTPLVIALAVHFRSIGCRPGIVSRGYGGRNSAEPHGVTGSDTPATVGDEALLLQRHSGVPVVVCADRVAAARHLVDRDGCNLIISDDGLQHHRLHRDLDIVVVDTMRGFGNGWCLPAGPLREPKSMLRRADIKVFNGAGAMDKDQEFGMIMEGAEAHSLRDRVRKLPLAGLAGDPVHAVAGIGNPERFFRHLEDAGLAVVRHEFPDHHTYTESDFGFAGDDSVILMTEKDAVKCDHLEIAGDVFCVPVAARISPGFFAAVHRHLDLGSTPRNPEP